ncbi:MAG TPA: hypothetical protein VNZ58_07120, partial [Thermomicrobiales bacterium]|nr:hypothetical protein [Thermomicrobiales bacterium]
MHDQQPIPRRTFIRFGLGAAAMTFGLLPSGRIFAANDNPPGKIAYAKDGDIWEWMSGVKPRRIVEDGAAMDPAWDPAGSLMLYARNGGSFSDLILINPQTGVRKALTDNESDAQQGSPDYVNGCSWALDPCWSHEQVACFVSDADAEYGEMSLWVILPEAAYAYEAASDGGDQGAIENVSVDGGATYCVYTVLAAGGTEGGTTYITLRDLNTGTTWPIIEGPLGAYDAAISPDSKWIVTSIRDENGVSDLWMFDREQETLTRLTENEQASGSVW